MLNKKKLSIVIILFLIFNLIYFCGDQASAQSKIIKKTVKKVVKPEIAPVEPPPEEPSPETEVIAPPPPPPPPPVIEEQPVLEDKGLFGWGINTDLGGKLLFGSILGAARGDIVFSDPLVLGEKIGLAEDAVEYKVGLGIAISDKLKTIPFFADTVVYLKEGSLFGTDPYVGAGLIYNLYGTGKVSGGLGGQIYLGVLADFGWGERTGITVGYAKYNVADKLSDSGICFTINQPLKL